MKKILKNIGKIIMRILIELTVEKYGNQKIPRKKRTLNRK